MTELQEKLLAATSVAEAWRLYEFHILPVAAGPNQRRETKKTFYAAVDWIFNRMMVAVDDEEAAERLMRGISLEMDEYVENLRRIT